MTLITFENGGPVFRDGKVGVAQECCCGEQDCPQGWSAGASVQLPLDTENLQARIDAALAAFIQYLTDENVFDLVEAAGYSNCSQTTEQGVTGEFVLANLVISCECCGEVDTTQEPTWEFGLMPGDIPDLASAAADPIYPCNPLP